MENVSKKKDFHGKCFDLTFRYIDDLLSINNEYFTQYMSLKYPNDLELKETIDNNLDVISLWDLLMVYMCYD